MFSYFLLIGRISEGNSLTEKRSFFRHCEERTSDFLGKKSEVRLRPRNDDGRRYWIASPPRAGRNDEEFAKQIRLSLRVIFKRYLV